MWALALLMMSAVQAAEMWSLKDDLPESLIF